MKKKKLNLKRKKVLIPVSIFIIILIVSITIYSIITYNKVLKLDIRNHYNKYLITTQKTNLYDKNNKIIGSISKDFKLTMTNVNDFSNKYFKIKDTDYYIYYKDLKKIKNIDKTSKNENHLVFNKNIKTKDKIILYKDNKKVLELDQGLNLPIEFIEDDEYNVYYLNNLLQIKKNKNIKEINKDNTKEIEADYISVIHYENINETCNDYNCITTNSIKEQINKLKENGYYTITLDEYRDYLAGNIRLKEKAILLTTSNQNDYINSINTELGTHIELITNDSDLKFNSTNKKSTKESDKNQIDRYQIKSYSTIDNILKMANGEEVVEQEPVKVTTSTNTKRQGIAVLNYHFFYDPNLGESCNEGICLTVQKFREHLDYLKNNGFKTLKMEEFTKWMYGEIQLPEKSVLITIDDGAMGTGKHNGNKLIPLLEEYKMNATLFLIAGWWDLGNYISPYLDVQSHTYDMHQYGTCGRGQLNCQPYEEVKADLEKSVEIIGNKNSFCFPFYYSSERSIQAVKDVGFRIAFVGGNRKATQSNNKYLIPRYPIHSNITLERFIDIVN